MITLCERGSIKAGVSPERFPAKPNIHEMGSNILPNGRKGEGEGSKWSSLVNGIVLLSKQHDPDRRKIRIIGGNAECQGTLRQVFICLRPRTLYPPPLLKHCIFVYSILIHIGKGEGRELNQREG